MTLGLLVGIVGAGAVQAGFAGNPDALSLWLAGGGVLGSALRAYMTPTQGFLSRQTVRDVVIGGLIGFVYPLYQGAEIPGLGFEVPVILGTPAQKAAIMAVVSYFGGDFLVRAIEKLVAFRESRQANGQKPPTPTSA